MNEERSRDDHRVTVEWLDSRYNLGVEQGRYLPFQPIYGYGELSEQGQVTKYARLLQILKQLSRIQFDSFLDVGGAEGFTAALVRGIFCPTVVNTDVSAEACARSRELFGLPSLSVEAASLPFGDNSFDVVLLSEVLEHLPDPTLAMLEGFRVCRKALILTTDEVRLSETERRRKMALADHTRPHTERNYFVPEDFQLLFGADVYLQSTLFFGSWDGSEPAPEDGEGLRRLILELSRPAELIPGSLGIVAVKEKEPGCRGRRMKPGPKQLLEKLLAFRAGPPAAGSPEHGPEVLLSAPELRGRVRCPDCLAEGATLRAGEQDGITCGACGAGFPVQAGVPVLRGAHNAAADRLAGPLLETYRRVRSRLETVPPLSSRPVDLASVIPLNGFEEITHAGGNRDRPDFFVWCSRTAAFRFVNPGTVAGLELILCSHHLVPPVSLDLTLEGSRFGSLTLDYGWSRLVLTPPAGADFGGVITMTFDRLLDAEEMAARHETVPGIEEMPPETAVRLHALRALGEADLLAMKLEEQTILLEQTIREGRRLAQRQAFFENMFPVRLYKKLRRMDW